MKKMLFCGFMSVMCMVAVGVEKPAGAKAPGEKPRVEAKKPGDAAKPTAAKPAAAKPNAKPAPAAKKPGEVKAVPAADRRISRRRAARGARTGAPAAGRPQVRMRAVPEPDDIPLSPADSRLIDAVDDAETMMELSRLMPKVLASHNPEVRQSMVDALEDKGRRGLNDLARFMADPDAEVADSAFSAWTSILEELPPSSRIPVIRAAARILTPPPPPAVQP